MELYLSREVIRGRDHVDLEGDDYSMHDMVHTEAGTNKHISTTT